MLQRQALFGIYLLLGREVKVDFLLILFLVFYLASTEWRKSPEPAESFKGLYQFKILQKLQIMNSVH